MNLEICMFKFGYCKYLEKCRERHINKNCMEVNSSLPSLPNYCHPKKYKKLATMEKMLALWGSHLKMPFKYSTWFFYYSSLSQFLPWSNPPPQPNLPSAPTLVRETPGPFYGCQPLTIVENQVTLHPPHKVRRLWS